MTPSKTGDARITKSTAVWLGTAGVIVLGAIQATWNMASGLYDTRDRLTESMHAAESRQTIAMAEVSRELARLGVRVDALERAVSKSPGER